MFFLMLLLFFFWEAQKEKKKRSVVFIQYKPHKSEVYALQYSDQVIKFFDAIDLAWVEEERKWRQPWAIEQRKKAFRSFNQKKLIQFVETEQGNRNHEPYLDN